MDSLIITAVAKKLIEGQIPFSLSHDSINLPAAHSDFVKKTYYDIFIQKVLIEDPLESFISANSSKLDPKTLDSLVEFKKNRIKILKLIKTEEYVMNPFILK